MPKVSLYIPCFNAEKTIEECLDSVMKQVYPIDEILIIDDGCQDSTCDIVSKYPVRVIKHGRNKGLASSRNTAFKEARNEFVASLDADCSAHPEWLKKLMDCFLEDDIAGAGGILKEKYSVTIPDRWRAVHMSQLWGEETIINPPFLYGSNTVLRKDIVKKTGMYNERYRNNYEDVNLSTRIYEADGRLIYKPEAVVDHLRQDTIASVFNNYWNWENYGYVRIEGINSSLQRAAVYLGRLNEFTETVEQFLREDLREGNFELILLDALFIFYYPILSIRYLFSRP